jgi:hypothetical protein
LGAAVIAAAAASRRELERTLEAFRVADATAVDRAQALDSLGLQDSRSLRRLVKAGVVLPGPVAAGRVYLSEAAYATYRRSGNRRQVVIAMTLAGTLILFGALMAIVVSQGAAPGAR